MATHTLLISTDLKTFSERVEPKLKTCEDISNYTFKKLKDKTLLQVKSEAKGGYRKIKNLVYSSGFYVKKKKSLISTLLLL